MLDRSGRSGINVDLFWEQFHQRLRDGLRPDLDDDILVDSIGKRRNRRGHSLRADFDVDMLVDSIEKRRYRRGHSLRADLDVDMLKGVSLTTTSTPT